MITINTNGICEWIAQSGRSNYQTPRIFWWTWLAIGVVIGMLVGSPAHASQDCMTYREARAEHSSVYLSWSGDHCWDAGRRAHVSHRHHEQAAVPLPRVRPDTAPAQEWIYADRWWVSELGNTP